MTPLNREKFPRDCVFCHRYCLSADIVLVRIDWPADRDRPQDKTYAEVPEGYSGIRSICVTCLAGLAWIHREAESRPAAGQTSTPMGGPD